MSFLTPQHKRWAANRKTSDRKRFKINHEVEYYLDLIEKQEGKCAFSDVPLHFDAQFGTAVKNGKGCHPLYASLDHTSPGSDSRGYGIVCYALNDVKGHLPHDCFVDLKVSGSWKRLMAEWRKQAALDPHDRRAFYSLLKQ
jgi:hypothetical protein